MLHKLLPLLFLVGCLDAPTTPVETMQASVAQPVANTDTRSPMYRSTDRGRTWKPIGEGLPKDLQVKCLDTLGKRIVLASNNEVYLSDPQKQSWRQLSTVLLPSLNITGLQPSSTVPMNCFLKTEWNQSSDKPLFRIGKLRIMLLEP